MPYVSVSITVQESLELGNVNPEMFNGWIDGQERLNSEAEDTPAVSFRLAIIHCSDNKDVFGLLPKNSLGLVYSDLPSSNGPCSVVSKLSKEVETKQDKQRYKPKSLTLSC